MAFSEQDGTSLSVISRFKLPGGAETQYVRISRIEVDIDGMSFTAMVKSYASKAARDNDVDSGLPEYVGGALNDEQLVLMAAQDPRSIIYPAIESIVLNEEL